MKKKNERSLMRAGICAVLLVIVILVILVLQMVLSKTQNKKNEDVQNTEAVTENTEMVSETTETMPATETEAVDTGKLSEVTLQNTLIENVDQLDNTCQNWGMGPSRDELNRPVDALSYNEKYAGSSVDFITNTEEKVIYLTFDEGYEYGCSEQILNTLQEKGVKAVFFVTKPYAESSPELVQRMIDDGHIVGNHTVNHPSAGLPSLSVEEQTNEVMETDAYIKENFGYSMYLFRFPAGKFSDQTLAVVNNCNYRSVFWSAAYQDWDVDNQPDPSGALQTILGKLHPGAIYLLHAESTTNATILGDFIDQVRAQGYEIGVYSDTLQK